MLCRRLEVETCVSVAAEELTSRELFLLLEGIEVIRERVRYAGPRQIADT